MGKRLTHVFLLNIKTNIMLEWTNYHYLMHPQPHIEYMTTCDASSEFELSAYNWGGWKCFTWLNFLKSEGLTPTLEAFLGSLVSAALVVALLLGAILAASIVDPTVHQANGSQTSISHKNGGGLSRAKIRGWSEGLF